MNSPEMLPLSLSEPTTGTVKEEILASQTPPDNQVSQREVQQSKARIVAAIRKPIPDQSAKLTELMNSPEMLPLSSSEPTTGTVKEDS